MTKHENSSNWYDVDVPLVAAKTVPRRVESGPADRLLPVVAPAVPVAAVAAGIKPRRWLDRGVKN